MSVKIISDSTCDLSKDLIEKYEIEILPLHVLLGEEDYLDGVTISPDEIYSWSDANKTTPKTSAPSIAEVIDIFEKWVAEGSEIVCFSISQQMSATCNVMKMAAEELGKEEQIQVVDSANLSAGVGLLVVKAAEMALEGKTAKEIAACVESLKPYVRASFVVDTLTYLYRGGRCSGLAALAGGALKLHPKIVVENGTMSPTKKYRGKMPVVIMSYVKDMEEQLNNALSDRVFITHSGCEPEVIEEVTEYLKSLGIFKEILVTRAGGVISSHCGPGTLGVLFIEQN
uniref:DegV family protein n=1 Tax=Acetatifactor sp. TaxID=1872090 RepID=UPI004055A776